MKSRAFRHLSRTPVLQGMLCGWLLWELSSAAMARGQPSISALATKAQLSEQLGQRVPVELAFRDLQNRASPLQSYLGGKPAVLVLAYARCTLLCNVVLQSLANAVAGLDELEPGRDYRLLTISIDSAESSASAASKQAALLARIGRPNESFRWPYLRGEAGPIAELARAIGFEYAWDPRSQQFVHPAVVFVLTPEHRVSARLMGVDFGSEALGRALRQAGQSRVGDADSSEIMRCFRFDPGARRYGRQIATYFRIGGGLIFLMLLATVLGLLLWERRRGHE